MRSSRIAQREMRLIFDEPCRPIGALLLRRREARLAFERSFDALDNQSPWERLVQEADSALVQCLLANLFVRVRCDKDQRNGQAPGLKRPLELQPAHSRHLHVRDNARGIKNVGRFQKVAAGFKGVSGEVH